MSQTILAVKTGIKCLIFSICLSAIIAIDCKSQNSAISLEDVKVDKIKLNEARYELKDFGKIMKQRTWKEEYEEDSKQFTELQHDSLEVLYYTNNRGIKYINWIKVSGRNHIVSYKETPYRINQSAESLRGSLPDIYSNYRSYISKNPNTTDTIYLGRPIKIVNKYNRSESYEGAFKFGIKNHKIKEIMIDLRPDGDYD